MEISPLTKLYRVTKKYWAFLALYLWGTLGLAMLISPFSPFISRVLSDSFGSFHSDFLDPPANKTESIRNIMRKLTNVSTPTKHTEGFLCVAYFGDLGNPGSAPPCPEDTEEMFCAVHKPSSHLFRLCCFMEHKIGRRQCGGLVPCGPSTSQGHCAGPFARFLNNGTTDADDWCRLEDERSCCIMGVVQNQAGTTLGIMAHESGIHWRRLRVVAYWSVLLAIFLPPFYLLYCVGYAHV